MVWLVSITARYDVSDVPSVYSTYMKAGKAAFTVPLIISMMVLMQSSSVLNSYTLVWWEDK